MFSVTHVRNQDSGRFEYWTNDPRRFGGDDDFDRELNFNGDHVGDFGRDHRKPSNHFEATAITSVIFSDNPAFQPGRRPRPTIDTVSFSGTGKGNGRPGYTSRWWRPTRANRDDTVTRSHWWSRIQPGLSLTA